MIVESVEIQAPDGSIDGQIVRPESRDKLPAVIQLTDIFGMRPAYQELAEQIAGNGYVVLTPNIFYRTTKPPVFDFVPDWTNERTLNRFKEITAPMTPDAMVRDGSAFVDYLATQPFVSLRPIGVVGYCFSGKFALRMAAARPDRIGAAASFHGGGLVIEGPDSPHLLLPHVKARLYFGHAENDRSMPAEAIEALDKALEEWGGRYESEVYAGAGHGWMIPGREIYHAEQAERGFKKLMALFNEGLRAPAGAR
jgi:carboxymethylenebutenolidase